MDDDERIVRSGQRGDEAEFTASIGGLAERVFRLAWRMTGDASLADEATSQVLFKVWIKAGQWRGQAAAGTWIYQLAVRTILDVERAERRRSRRRERAANDEAADPRLGPVEQAELAEQRQAMSAAIQAALTELAPADRALVHLYYYENRPLGEIETILDTKRDVLKTRLARARERLKHLLKADYAAE